ncbi:hypothetical protein CONCODRAFT_3935 [Conidiobolus coronatus NRRL 28638]|uniref:NAD(P)-binding protein n=1 Tax=Conidiobolus coronatus (strain ATCC 28846 / CBS 209.66 / NRRL 28638) TaxID=796925 RepID=A0A137PE61_CONC2|nr:hypothetical protein CONCODRAFT_3935 [Conidiobolus coronatus NRRL 28638]|eukprot:KXN73255.1 hypothetical protein CONCODRAFT_3935 [Conidiobolus coronatus NRRL 28638]
MRYSISQILSKLSIEFNQFQSFGPFNFSLYYVPLSLPKYLAPILILRKLYRRLLSKIEALRFSSKRTPIELTLPYELLAGVNYKTILENAFKIIKPGGKVVSISGLPNARFADEYKQPLWKKLAFSLATRNLTKLEKETKADYYFLFMKPSGEQLEILGNLLEKGKIKPVIGRVIPFEQINEAFEYSKSGRAKGKIILKIGDEI